MLFILQLIAWSILGIQIVYLILFIVAFARKRPVPVSTTPPVSIIVCAHDEEVNLRALVPILLQQDYPEMEVIIVEDRSNDGTFDFLLDATKKDKRLKMVRVQHLPGHLNGKKFALTLGIRAATHAWILLTDADCRPQSNQWVKMMTSFFQEKTQIVVGYSPLTKSKGYLNAFIRFESLLTGIQFMGWALLGRPYMGVGRNLAYRKSLFLENKGFNNYLGVTGGDDDLFVNEHATKVNTSVCIMEGSLMLSIPKGTWREFFYQKLRHLSAGKRYKTSDKLVLGLFSLTWILTWTLALPMLLISPLESLLIAGFILREIVLMGVVHRASRALGDPFESWTTPLLDFNYAIYYLGTGLAALVSKRVRWKI